MIRGPVFLGHQEAGIRISSWNSLSSKRQLNMKDCVPPADLSLSFTSEIRQVEAALTSGSYLPDMIKIPQKSTYVSVAVVESPHSNSVFICFFITQMSLRPGDIAQVEDPEFNQQHSEPRPAAWERWDCLGHFGTELTVVTGIPDFFRSPYLYCLVVTGTMEFYDFPLILGTRIPCDELIFFRGVG